MSGPLPPILAPLAIPASWLYGLAVTVRNRRYDRADVVARVEVPVISVGNVTAGGAGKSPMTRWLAGLLLARGHRPVIAMRGYGARAGETPDEAAECAEHLPGVPVLVDPDRHAALRAHLPAHPETDCVLLDDGFQHRRLHRDLDLVLLDATASTLDGRLLPWGYLREPPASLRRADAVIVTRADGVDPALAGAIERLHGRPPLAWCRHAWAGLRLVAAGTATERSVENGWLCGKRVLAMFGLGNPRAALRQLREAGAEIVVNEPVRDHHRYSRAGIERVRRLAEPLDAVVLSGKDWVKVRHLIDSRSWPVPIVVPDLALDIHHGAEALAGLVVRTVETPRPR